MKNSILATLTILSSLLVFGQEPPERSILLAHDNWGKEIIEFPIDWAPNLSLEGFEELRFSPYWSNPNHEQFWSLVMAWKINTTAELTLKDIERNFEAYFDGLMKPNHWATTFSRPTALFLPNTNPKDGSFIGKMKLFDGFHTGNMIRLNITVTQHFCKKRNTSIIVFRMSPKEFEHSIWNELNGITDKPIPCK